MNSNVHCIVPRLKTHLENVVKRRLYETPQICACMIQAYYDAIWRYYVTSTEWYMKGIWCKQWMTSYDANTSYESICSMHVCCVYVVEWYCYEVFVCMMHTPYETSERQMSVVWSRMTWKWKNDVFGNKRDQFREQMRHLPLLLKLVSGELERPHRRTA